MGLRAGLNVSFPDSKPVAGLALGFSAYLVWGFFPVFFKTLVEVAPLEILAHRIIWSVVFLGILLGFRGRWRENLATAFKPRALALLSVTTVLIALNWFTFIWAVGHDQTVQASLGYFINPLINVLLGYLFLRERLRPWQRASTLLAAAGVAYLTIRSGEVPVIALVLAFSFGFYGLLRKTARADALLAGREAGEILQQGLQRLSR